MNKLIVWWTAVLCAPLLSANPLDDSDNDGVVDIQDVCPDDMGEESNHGCPADQELVFHTGTRPGPVTCPDATVVDHWYECPTYPSGWGTYHVVYWPTPSANYISKQTFSDEDGDTVLDEDDQCRETDGDPDFHGCDADTYCLEIDSAYEKQCLYWAADELSLGELGAYYADLRAFAEGGCGGDVYHWACFGVYNYQRISLASVWDTLKDFWVDAFSHGLSAPTCPDGFMPQMAANSYGGFVLYSGTCINVCRQALFHAGILTTATGGASALAASNAGRAAISAAVAAAGLSLDVDALIPFCDGPTWVVAES